MARAPTASDALQIVVRHDAMPAVYSAVVSHNELAGATFRTGDSPSARRIMTPHMLDGRLDKLAQHGDIDIVQRFDIQAGLAGLVLA